MRYAILGNSGSGKSTLARTLSEKHELPVLDLDTIYWEPDQPGVPRPLEQAKADLSEFITTNDNWVVEGCYEDLIAHALSQTPTFLLMDPGVEQCLKNCHTRPWEAHKYDSKELQDERLPALLDWVKKYYSRDGVMSYQAHNTLFEHYDGPKERVTNLDY